jgi:hypothetical protein
VTAAMIASTTSGRRASEKLGTHSTMALDIGFPFEGFGCCWRKLYSWIDIVSQRFIVMADGFNACLPKNLVCTNYFDKS